MTSRLRLLTLILTLLVSACQKAPPHPPTPSSPPPTTQPTDSPQPQAPPPAVAPHLQPPTEPTGEATDEQRLLLNKAKSAFLLGDTPSAEAAFSSLLKTSPLSPEKQSGILALSQIYLESDREELALNLLSSLQHSLPDLPEPYFLSARIHAAQNKPNEAIAQYRALLHHQPDYLLAYVELAALLTQSDPEAAAKVLHDYERRLYAFAKVVEDKHATPEDKRYALSVLTLTDDDRSSLAFDRALRDPIPEVRIIALEFLAQDNPPDTTYRWIEAMAQRDPSVPVRLAAKEATAKILQTRQDLDTYHIPTSDPSPPSP